MINSTVVKGGGGRGLFDNIVNKINQGHRENARRKQQGLPEQETLSDSQQIQGLLGNPQPFQQQPVTPSPFQQQPVAPQQFQQQPVTPQPFLQQPVTPSPFQPQPATPQLFQQQPVTSQNTISSDFLKISPEVPERPQERLR